MVKANTSSGDLRRVSTAAAYKRYLEKFDKQETQIEEYQATIKKL